MLIQLSKDCFWEIISVADGTNKALQRKGTREGKDNPLTIKMDGYEEWKYDNLEDLQGVTDDQCKVIFAMNRWGQKNWKIERQQKIIFSP